MILNSVPLAGSHVRLEPLERYHVDGLAAAAAMDPSLYQWASVPQGREGFERYVDAALAAQQAGQALAFAIVRVSDRKVIGSTRFWGIERWSWPAGHVRHGGIDGCEIGYTWLSSDALRTPANTEAKLLLMTRAFEQWRVLRVCFHTDVRNLRSAAALERIGATCEGILRAHRLAVDNIARDSRRYSIVVAEWPEVKARLSAKLG